MNPQYLFYWFLVNIREQVGGANSTGTGAWKVLSVGNHDYDWITGVKDERLME